MGDHLSLSEVLAAKRSEPPSGMSLVRFVRCLGLARSTRLSLIAAVAEQNFKHDEKLQLVMRTAVASGTLGNLSELAPYRVIANEFVQASRASSIVGRLAARVVPLRVKIPRLGAGASSSWIGEGAPKAVSVMSLDTATLDGKKSSSIVVTTDELARFAGPGSDQLLRDDLIRAVNSGIDTTFIGNSAATSSTPAGILNGTTPVTSTGSTPAALAADVRTVINAMVAAGGQAQSLVILAHPGTMAQVGLILGATGASLGIPVITSTVVPTGKLIVVDQAEVLLGRDDGIEMSLTSEASVMMDSAPVDGTTAYTSLWQHNLVGIRAEQFVNWQPLRAAAATAGSVTAIA